MTLQNLNNAFETVEKCLNWMGYIPVVGTLSGCARYSFGELQFTMAIAIAAINYVGAVFAENEERQRNLESRTVKSLEYAVHGCLNMGRAFLEIVPFVSLVTCLPYDLRGEKWMVYADTENHPRLAVQ
ncbi:hypothetical protein PNK_1214 [Candidatus Protochlamydia naegleriophila]|uniref:Uncharacterized protein n=1 Tax=Candidatus Protochlamydia naegleriophila TaxID=389348 RepID=A0A0U5JEN4_9BACT|nr:hypothetical protein [Candidatus Protochlamydia naegleriophila]CUI16831.1 hypothetical protein PNK_1214 [Candidatus Protochlamydia naegleriophila]